MEHERDTAIKARAYQLWEESGRAEGRHDEHWRRAVAECSVENGEAGTSDGVHHSGSVSVTDMAETGSHAKDDHERQRVPAPIAS